MQGVMEVIETHFPNCRKAQKDKVIFDVNVRKMCEQNTCGQYGRNWTCPPAVDSLDDIKTDIGRFDTFVVVYKVYPLKSSFDFEGMVLGIADFRKRLLKLKKALPEGKPYKILGAGSCMLCKKCSYRDGEPCIRPEDAFVSVEACGIDVMRLMSDNGLKYNNGKDTVTYIGAIIYDE
jgi:predicted metal-binding protein